MTERYRKKLIEVSLPLEAINAATINEKALRHGHPSTLHIWWSRKPLAACRAILFASLVDDPSAHADVFKTEEEQEQERQRLFGIIKELVQWKNIQNDDLLKRAATEIKAPEGEEIPPVRDPFCGGGSIPLEALRLGLQARSSDLNPVAVLITKALIEIPPKFADLPPVAPNAQQALVKDHWHGAQGLADDIRYYGKWMRDEAEKRIGNLYPKVYLPSEYGGGGATVIAWLWVRTVTCPNPACGACMPLTSQWWLSRKKQKETWVEPVVDKSGQLPIVHFLVKRRQQSEPQPGTVNRRGAKCIVCNTPVPFSYIRKEGNIGRIGAQLMAIAAEGPHERVYLPSSEEHEDIAVAMHPEPVDVPETMLPVQALSFRVQVYGMRKHRDLFTARQLIALTTFSNLVQEARERVFADAQQSCLPDDFQPLHNQGIGAVAYADAIATYLAIAVDRLADRSSALCSWDAGYTKVRNTFARQAIPMIWDFAEANPFSESTGNFLGGIDWVAKVIEKSPCGQQGESCLGGMVEKEQEICLSNLNAVYQRDATETINGIPCAIIATDPPYYDNIGYADLSDFFYVWLRRSLQTIYPELFKTVLTPKDNELVASPYRFGNKEKARAFFEKHLGEIFKKMREMQSEHYPLILYYAFKQAETEAEDKNAEDGHTVQVSSSTGWEAMLESLVQTGFTITGTWPIRTEMANRSTGQKTNSLASSIVLICRPRPTEVGMISLRQFLKELRDELPPALKQLQHDSIPPVDLAQACIGPGMAIYSRYSQVVEADGTVVHVRKALQLINQTLDEVLVEQEGEYDAETRWALTWFEQHGLEPGSFGTAETLSKAKNVSVPSMKQMGWLESAVGKVRLRKREELSANWPARQHEQIAIWEVLQRMTAALDTQGEKGAAMVLRTSGKNGEVVRDLAYRLYTVCDRKKWSSEAQLYNNLVTSWPQIRRSAQDENNFMQQQSFL